MRGGSVAARAATISGTLFLLGGADARLVNRVSTDGR
jgi:hypothetical protein